MWIVIGAIACAGWLWLVWGARPITRTKDEVIAVLESVLVSLGDNEWDDFVSVKIQDPELDRIRQRCGDLQFQDHETFQAGIREMLAELKQDKSSIVG